MNKLCLAVTLVIASAGSFATASAAEYSATKVIDHFDESSLVTTALAFDAKISPIEKDEAEEKIYRLEFASGYVALAQLTACEDNGTLCRGTHLMGYLPKPKALTDDLLDERIAAFNGRYIAAKAILGTNGNPAVQAYVISDGGITLKNYGYQIELFESFLMALNRYLANDSD